MPTELTSEEATVRKQMSAVYKAQERFTDGYADWGQFTAHVVCTLRAEVLRLRKMLADRKIDAGAWHDPLESR
jgi:hypothetical protein